MISGSLHDAPSSSLCAMTSGVRPQPALDFARPLYSGIGFHTAYSRPEAWRAMLMGDTGEVKREGCAAVQ